MTTTPAPPGVLDELRRAAATIQTATLKRPGHATPDRLTEAHQTLDRLRPYTTGARRQAIDTYLDDDTWHHGPLALLQAINTLTWQLDIPNPHTCHITEQPALFDTP